MKSLICWSSPRVSPAPPFSKRILVENGGEHATKNVRFGGICSPCTLGAGQGGSSSRPCRTGGSSLRFLAQRLRRAPSLCGREALLGHSSYQHLFFCLGNNTRVGFESPRSICHVTDTNRGGNERERVLPPRVISKNTLSRHAH